MVVYFFDSSALVKRYMDEPGSEWVRQILAEFPFAAIAEITLVEVVAALARRWRMGEITIEEYRFTRGVFLKDVRWYQVFPTSQSTVERAIALIDHHPLRAYDALQLATALQLADALRSERLSLTFVSADERLCAAAEQEGLP
ncbi:MAG: type II toxin-antitoxin system VapC family toxin, partial [Anaerolineae bacterium]|nr:type II toxin-antitoxin system VapC family toxin [Anaerolineae bacterium]